MPDKPRYRLQLGITLARNPKWRKEAEEHLLRAEELTPWDAKIQIALGDIYADANLASRAKARYKKAAELDPPNKDAPARLDKLGKDKSSSGEGLLGRLARMRVGKKAAPAKSSDKQPTVTVL